MIILLFVMNNLEVTLHKAKDMKGSMKCLIVAPESGECELRGCQMVIVAFSGERPLPLP